MVAVQLLQPRVLVSLRKPKRNKRFTLILRQAAAKGLWAETVSGLGC